MDKIDIWESDYRFMLIVWEHAPVNSGRLVELSLEKLGWKKSTTYNAIRRMSEKGLVKSENAIVSVVIPKEHVQADQTQAFLDRTFSGSLPTFLATFLDGKYISSQEAEEIKRLIDAHREKPHGHR